MYANKTKYISSFDRIKRVSSDTDWLCVLHSVKTGNKN